MMRPSYFLRYCGIAVFLVCSLSSPPFASASCHGGKCGKVCARTAIEMNNLEENGNQEVIAKNETGTTQSKNMDMSILKNTVDTDFSVEKRIQETQDLKIDEKKQKEGDQHRN